MYASLKLLALGLGHLSDRTVTQVAHGISIAVFDILRLRRKLVLDNLAIAFPEKTEEERIHIGRQSVFNFTLTMMEFLRSGQVDIAKNVRIDGANHLKAALQKGHGVYILCFHMGNWEAMGAAINRHFVPAHVLVKRVGSSSVNRFVEDIRDKIRFLAVKRQKKGDGFRAIAEILKRGEIVGFVMDQARPGEPRIDFFGHPAKTNTSLAAIWRRLPAPIVPAWIERHQLGHHTLRLFPELTVEATDNEASDILALSAYFNQVIASHVAQRPDLYFWMHNRWKD